MCQLASSGEQFSQQSLRFVWQLARLRLDLLSEQGNDLSIDSVGLSPLSECFCEVSDLFGIDDCDRDFRVCESSGGEVLQASACFHNGEFYTIGQFLDPLIERVGVSSNVPGLAVGQAVSIEPVLGQVNAENENGVVIGHQSTLPCRYGLLGPCDCSG